MRPFQTTCLILCSLLAMAAHANNIEMIAMDNEFNNAPSASRPPPPVVAPIEHEGVRYQQGGYDSQAGEAPGRFLSAIDIKSGAVLWRLRVYSYPDYSAEGLPIFDRFFRTMRMMPDGKTLEILDESGGIYQVDIVSRTATQVGGPPASAPAKPHKPKPPPPAAPEPEVKVVPKTKWFSKFF